MAQLGRFVKSPRTPVSQPIFRRLSDRAAVSTKAAFGMFFKF